MEKEIKQVIILRKDVKMGTGKMVAQGSHASLMSFLHTEKSYPEIAKKWLAEGETKIVLKVNKEDEFEELKNRLKRSGIPFQVVKDAGQTQVPPGTETAIGVGPYYTDEINKITAKLKLL
ncbi:MAG: peptidyl-tRNA hydrolase Pth2 [Candidatus Parvarchaeota archaeon]|nr:peptidyl-tRNA hydrolase Pth2 [Candidatus Parvarchaeota archaeon]MCW1295470.1 peptidyl-tRNA hydrolase Pth2 [Candidatus Parvarchaeum tengchongense]MCW1299161.1 peptidyl-tRNA hydrolase Pth2 [Candidatus Parvarchaeum tengchongense]MCW1312593.1 peptidyl-tRNA hydrolase Pth2 [Candidatus Parvarchaeum tengchongense]